MRAVVAVLVLLPLLSSPGCDGSQRVCAPGRTVECACPGGVKGAQTCSGDGAAWEPCRCPGEVRVDESESKEKRARSVNEILSDVLASGEVTPWDERTAKAIASSLDDLAERLEVKGKLYRAVECRGARVCLVELPEERPLKKIAKMALAELWSGKRRRSSKGLVLIRRGFAVDRAKGGLVANVRDLATDFLVMAPSTPWDSSTARELTMVVDRCLGEGSGVQISCRGGKLCAISSWPRGAKKKLRPCLEEAWRGKVLAGRRRLLLVREGHELDRSTGAIEGPDEAGAEALFAPSVREVDKVMVEAVLKRMEAAARRTVAPPIRRRKGGVAPDPARRTVGASHPADLHPGEQEAGPAHR